MLHTTDNSHTETQCTFPDAGMIRWSFTFKWVKASEILSPGLGILYVFGMKILALTFRWLSARGELFPRFVEKENFGETIGAFAFSWLSMCGDFEIIK